MCLSQTKGLLMEGKMIVEQSQVCFDYVSIGKRCCWCGVGKRVNHKWFVRLQCAKRLKVTSKLKSKWQYLRVNWSVGIDIG